MIYVMGPRDRNFPDYPVINVTTGSKNQFKNLSPMILGPTKSFDGKNCLKMENLWQYSKVYKNQVDMENNPDSAWWEWRHEGFSSSWANRYPMGKGIKPLYSFWNYEKLGYIEARKKIYVPYYSELVKKTAEFKELQELYKKEKNLILWDYDGYNHIKLNMSLEQVLNDETRIMGHAFVLAQLLI